MFKNREEEIKFYEFLNIKKRAGSHSPSLNELKDVFQQVEVKVDACYLSNPYATELFVKYLKEINYDKLKNIVEYYPSQNPSLANCLSNFLNIDSSNILVGNGASEIISFLSYNFLEGRTLLPIPTFSPYYEYISEKLKIIYLKLREDDEFLFNLDYLKKFIMKNRIDNLILINPNNPTGSYIEYDQLIKFFDFVYDYLRWIILDESFIHFVDANDIPNYYKLLRRYPKKLIIVKSMSKDFGISGLRIGYMVADESIIHRCLKAGFLWNISGFGEYFLRLVGYEENFISEYKRVRKKYIEDTNIFFNNLKNIFKTYPSKANFSLMKVPINADIFTFLLFYRYGIYVRSAIDKIGLNEDKFIRVSSRTKQENDLIINALKDIKKNL